MSPALPSLLQSTTLAAADYDGNRGQLRIDFRDGSRYAYSGVPVQLFLDLIAAPSKGAFFNRRIRGRFVYVKIAHEN